VEMQRKIHGQKKRRDTVAKMRSQPLPPEPKQRRVEAVIDISDEEVVKSPKKPIISSIPLAEMFPDTHHLLREYARRFPVSMKPGWLPTTVELSKVQCMWKYGMSTRCEQAMQGSSDYCLEHEETKYLAKEEEDHDRLEQLAYVAEANKPEKKSV
jgi:hypothetical protein